MKVCKAYCGVACIDGSCPNAWREDNPEYFQDVYGTLKPLKCKDCSYNKGCEDCCIAYYKGISVEQCRKENGLEALR